MFGVSEAIDQIAMASIVHWYCDVFKREDFYVLRRALEFEVDGNRGSMGS